MGCANCKNDLRQIFRKKESEKDVRGSCTNQDLSSTKSLNLPLVKASEDVAGLNANSNTNSIIGINRVNSMYTKDKEYDSLPLKMEYLILKNSSRYDKEYSLIKKIGIGTYGTVYKAIHNETHLIRAIKVIKKKNVKSGNLNFIKEIEYLKGIQHPNIIKILEYFEDTKHVYLVIEYLPEGDLYNRLFNEDEVEINEETICVIMKQLLSAICFMHSKGILHGDIKPQNILVEKITGAGKNNGNGGVNSYTDISIKICDFGACNRFVPDELFHERIGSPYYIAPEVLNKEYNEKCDLWSCGIVMYFLLTGVMPFEGRNDAEVVKNILRGVIDFDNDLFDSISIEAKILLKRLLTYEYKERITAEEALQCDWFKNDLNFRQSIFENSFSDLMINRVKKFNAKAKLQQATVAFIVHYLDSNDEIMKLKKIFYQINKRGDGRLSPIELKEGLMQIKGQLISENEILHIFKNLDQDKNGYIDIEEFLRASLDHSLILNETNLKSAFNKFDRNKDGMIDREELKFIFQSDDNNYIDELIKKIDQNKDGKIDFKEFSDVMNILLQDILSNRSSVKSLFAQSVALSDSSATYKFGKSRFSKEVKEIKDQSHSSKEKENREHHIHREDANVMVREFKP